MQLQNIRLRSVWLGAGSILIFVGLWLSFIRAVPTSSGLPQSAGSFKRPFDSLEDVLNRTLGFQKIFVINLPYRTDHRDSMSLAAALTDIDVTYVDGVSEVKEKARPPLSPGLNLDQGGLGAWRAHMNTLRLIVEQNITSALILEDDADWDIRIKPQMQDFARASRLLVQPLVGTTDHFLDPTYPEPTTGQQPQDFVIDEHKTEAPMSSPYGEIDRWDLLWLGHCGCRFPETGDKNTPLGRAVIPNDQTVPERQHVHMQFGNSDLVNEYPDHTRVVSWSRVNTCSLAYAVSQLGARRLLYEMGVNLVNGPLDLTLRSICEGSEGRKRRSCLTVQPQLFQHHRSKGSKASYSDVSLDHKGNNEQAFTRNVRWSTRLNFPKLIDGETDYIDLFKDGEQMPDIGFR